MSIDTGRDQFHQEDLKADCERCFGLCCVALPFARSVDFAADKQAGVPCSHLRQDNRCDIHSQLREKGFRGCTVFDCFGAGQKVSQLTYEGRDWRQHPDSAKQMYAVFPVMWQLHELLWYLSEALAHPAAASLREPLHKALSETEQLSRRSPESLLEIDISTYRAKVNTLLLETSERVRKAAQEFRGEVSVIKAKRSGKPPHRYRIERGADLMGAKLAQADLRGSNLRGALLIAADLRGSDVRGSDWIGADLRDADLRGADLRESLFLTPVQLSQAKGDDSTKLPPSLTRPKHWSGKADDPR